MNLCRLIDDLNMDLFNNKQIINGVNSRIEAFTSKETLEKIIGDVLTKTSALSKDKEIQITAKPFHNIILIQVKYLDYRAISEIGTCYKEIQTHIKSLGGCLYVTKRNDNLTTISFTLLNYSSSAVA